MLPEDRSQVGRQYTRCDWCLCKTTGESQRASAEIVDLASLGGTDPEQLPLAERLKFIERRVWPADRVTGLLASLHMRPISPLLAMSDGFDPVHMQCLKCGYDNVDFPARLRAHVQQGWCTCRSCGGRNGPCSEDILNAFRSRGLKVDQELITEDRMHARCLRCDSPRYVSLAQIRRGVINCYTCDGAADPTRPHRVYLFHFPHLSCFKIGITNTGNDSRLVDHQNRSGRLTEIVEVPNRAAAVALEQQVLSAMQAFPSAALPGDFPQNGWTETWRDDAPTVRLIALVPDVADVKVPEDLLEQWRQFARERENPSAVDNVASTVSLGVGAVVVFTGKDPVPRDTWKSIAARRGISVMSTVTSAVSALVTNDRTANSAKVRAAETHAVPMISYSDFLKAIELLPTDQPIDSATIGTHARPTTT